ncbi:hypothetical protein TNCV_2454871 [Trichonephila clavipes]|nr:hypothetical protein TNCV_2454871 [Trichonephila clavipes]
MHLTFPGVNAISFFVCVFLAKKTCRSLLAPKDSGAAKNVFERCVTGVVKEIYAIGSKKREPPMMADKVNLEFVQSSKNIIDADSDEENQMNKAAPVPTSSETL